MTPESLLDGKVTLWPGDCREALRHLPDASIDSVVTDPPYALVSIQKRFGKPGAAPAQHGRDGLYARASAGFMGQQWDTGETAFAVDFWREVFRVLKPGGHVAAFAGTRTYHRLACAVEDAGFEIRDQLAWVYGSGFPKSHDVAKGIDKSVGAVGGQGAVKGRSGSVRNAMAGDFAGGEYHDYIPATDAARQWQGWGTALKPAWEPIVLARKPLVGTVAENVLQHGTGALNVAGCSIGNERRVAAFTSFALCHGNALGAVGTQDARRGTQGEPKEYVGRFPANIVHDGSGETVAAFPDGVARFFYSAKADADDRLGSKHPTVKPVDLMQWLVRLITPPGGLVLDPFAGTGTTGEAAWREGMRAVLVEREAAYQADIRRRMELALAGPATRRAAARAAAVAEPSDGLGIFGAIGASEKEDV